ncbi:50S ribosomal protein L3 [Prosthecochloris marina]|uniref:Large ribosomal subunit protein uL3 n=1 Tax=Prosthecochloris marina TaxID=2017681 RepID=A0A317T8G1_9CHLB|nr:MULTISPECIES: 50S ribosomal protein L3 [Prosthecochloris]PWW82818.1 50S ribosomal protein L3 [Prosthecochloris marina]
MAAILGKKIGMTSIYDENREAVPCTVIQAGPCFVSQVKTVVKDGYEAYQLSIGERKEAKVSKPLRGHYAKAGVVPGYKVVEFEKDLMDAELEEGGSVSVEMFREGETVDVRGVSKGKGFAGVVKRHNFGGGSRTHGQSDRLRAPGSVGGASDPSRTFKGTKMAGRMGGKTVRVKGLKIMKVIPESNLLVVKGAVPGVKNSYVQIVSSKK